MKNKTLWTDTNGSAIQAHGGMILQHEGMYYWKIKIRKRSTDMWISLEFPVIHRLI